MESPAQPIMRIGIMGGSFDPVHNGHLKVAEAARTAMQLQKVIFVAAHCPPHKSVDQLTPVAHRHAMVELAICGIDHFESSRIEAERSCPTYVGDTIEYYRQQLGGSAALFFITGLDALPAIINWNDAKTYPGICRFIAVPRPGCDHEEILRHIPHNFLPYITILDEPCVSISSTEIRSRIRTRRSVEGMVPDAVRQYIDDHNLYFH